MKNCDPMKAICLSTVTAILILSGCSDSLVTEPQEAYQVEEVLEHPATIKNEPPELVTKLEQLIAVLTVSPDSATMVQAWTIAMELAQYEGPMADAFATMEAVAAGDTAYALVKDHHGVKGRVLGKTTPCEDACYDASWTAAWIATDHLRLTLIGCGVAGGAATIALILSGGTALPAVLVGVGACAGIAVLDYWVDRGHILDVQEACLLACADDVAGRIEEFSVRSI